MNRNPEPASLTDPLLRGEEQAAAADPTQPDDVTAFSGDKDMQVDVGGLIREFFASPVEGDEYSGEQFEAEDGESSFAACEM